MKNDFCYMLRVRYSECDAQKVVFNGRYVDYIDLAATEFMRATWGNYNDLLSKGIDLQVVSLTLNWKAPAHFDEVIAITVKPGKIGTTSYGLGLDFHNHENSKHLLHADIVYVMVSADQHRKMEIPGQMRQTLEKGAPGVRVNHSGT
ncbi:MAG: acyl-CoA thioesterase [Desulfobacterales bacterium]|nr:acyl-CoA thioesterase [Desulfobacterales bacterium]